MKKIELTRRIAIAASIDEANRNMRKNGRKRWNLEDMAIASATLAELELYILGNIAESIATEEKPTTSG